jgi:hypothetical protein
MQTYRGADIFVEFSSRLACGIDGGRNSELPVKLWNNGRHSGYELINYYS